MITFAKSVLLGLYEAFKTDVNVFLIGMAALSLSFRRGRGLGAALIFYTTLRRADDFMSVYVRLKTQELELVKAEAAEING